MAVQAPANLASTEHKKLITGEELYQMSDLGRTELIRGEIVSMSPTGYLHGHIETNLSSALKAFVTQRKLGRVFSGEVGIYTQRNPDTVRGADVAFISNERMAQVKSKSYLDVAPELIVEIMSPDDAWSGIMEKLDEYFSIGVKLVWVVDPRTRQVYAYRSVTNVERFTESANLSAIDVLAGFEVPIGE